MVEATLLLAAVGQVDKATPEEMLLAEHMEVGVVRERLEAPVPPTQALEGVEVLQASAALLLLVVAEGVVATTQLLALLRVEMVDQEGVEQGQKLDLLTLLLVLRILVEEVEVVDTLLLLGMPEQVEVVEL